MPSHASRFHFLESSRSRREPRAQRRTDVARAVRAEQVVREAVVHVRAGGLVVYPTETSYAIGCDAAHPDAVAAVFRVKGRAETKMLPLIVASLAMAKRYAVWNTTADRLARAHWPGALTVVLPSRSRSMLAPGIVAADGTIAIRMSSHPIARGLSAQLDRPIVSTSANRSGASVAYAPEELRALREGAAQLGIDVVPLIHRGLPRGLVAVELRRIHSAQRVPPRSRTAKGGDTAERESVRGNPDPRAKRALGSLSRLMVLDGGALPHVAPSTIVDCVGSAMRVLRQGSVVVR